MFENEDQPALTAIQWFNKGYDYDVQEDYDNAILAYSKAIELNPKDADAYNNRGAIYDIKKEYDLAIQDYNKAIELTPEDADLYINKLLACQNSGKYTSAEIEVIRQKIIDLGGQI